MDWLNENKTSKTPFYSIVKPLIKHNRNNKYLNGNGFVNDEWKIQKNIKYKVDTLGVSLVVVV